MKNLKILIPILLLTTLSFAQTKFDAVDFNQKFEVAKWLVEYDLIAWKTSDEVMKEDKKELEKLGPEWFCFQDADKIWHAVYGKYENAKFNLVFHYKVDKDSQITKTGEKVDEESLDLYARSLVTANTKLQAVLKDKPAPRFNQYIRQNSDKSFTVWLLPAFQTNGLAVYGGEAIYTIDKTGDKITKDESYFQKNFRGFMTGNPREIWLNYEELERPTLGAVFFVWYYKRYFTKIMIDTAKSTSTVSENMWIHLEKGKP